MTTRPRRLEDRLHAVEHLTREARELRPAMIDRRLRQRAQDAIGNVGRARESAGSGARGVRTSVECNIRAS